MPQQFSQNAAAFLHEFRPDAADPVFQGLLPNLRVVYTDD
jgi:hypothetical protein